MKKFFLRTFMNFSIIFIFLFSATMLIEYTNKDKLQSNSNIKISIDEDGKIIVPDTPPKVEVNYLFSKFYFYVNLAISVATPLLFYKAGGVEIIKNKSFKKKFIEGGVLCILYSVFAEILLFPKVLFSSFYRGRLVGLKTYSFLQFMWDYISQDFINLVISIVVVAIVYTIFINRKRWFLIVAALSILFSLVSNYIYPYIDEMQNDLVVMENSELKSKILKLADKAGIDNLDIRIVKKSDETTTMNAYMTGIGNSRRIVFWDTIIDGLSEEELLSVAAHEMGHYKLNHIMKSFILSSLGMVLLCIVIDLIMKKYKGNNYRTIDNIPKMLFILSLISILITPIETWYSRKIEVEADRFAIENTGDWYTNGALEIRFVNSNLTPIKVDKLFKWLAYDHPTVEERIKLSNEYCK